MTSTPPTGTVTFLFTDIEGSTALWEQDPQVMQAGLAQHHAVLREAIETHYGHIFTIAGDAFCAAFATAPDALAAAVAAQRALQSPGPRSDEEPITSAAHRTSAKHRSVVGVNQPSTTIRVRMGLHTGSAEAVDRDYRSGPTLNRAARVMGMAHGGQILLSEVTAGLLRGQLLRGLTLRDLGEHRLKGFADRERLFQVCAPDLESTFPAPPSADSLPGSLPVQVTSFIGREREKAEIKGLLPYTRLLTLTGSGGTGKTRLSLAVASELRDQFPDGAWFVELAALADPAFVPQAVATVLGLREEPGRPILTTVKDYLGNKHLLLVLDNCEHLIEACAQLADGILHASPHVTLLASSREALGIAGETAYRVPSLPAPAPTSALTASELARFDAVRLFVERAAAARPGFVLDDANANAVAQICYRLDGIPLAIELAAARSRVFSPEQIAARLDDRFRLLTGGSRTALPRQQTLRGAIDWSYSLLSEPERALLRRLSVFAGGWTIEAAEPICADDVEAGLSGSSDHAPAPGQPQLRQDIPSAPDGAAGAGGLPLQPFDVFDLLSHLVDKSLVVADQRDGEARYGLLETVRQYARDKLLEAGESEGVRDRHLAYFARFVSEGGTELFGAQQVRWLARFEAEHDNLRAAIEWSSQRPDVAPRLRLLAEMFPFWHMHGYQREGMAALRHALTQTAGEIWTAQTAPARIEALLATIYFLWTQENIVEARPYAEEALALGRQFEETAKLGRIYQMLGQVTLTEGDYAASHPWLVQALAMAQELDDSQGLAATLRSLGDEAYLQGDFLAAQRYYAESAALFERMGDINFRAYLLRRLGHLAIQRGELDQAQAFIAQSLANNIVVQENQGLIGCLAALAVLSDVRGRTVRAVTLFSGVAALLESTRKNLVRVDRMDYERGLATARARLSESDFAAAWSAGQTLTIEQAIAFARQADA